MVTMGRKTSSSRRQRIGGREEGSVVAQWVWGNLSYAARRYAGLVVAVVSLALSAVGAFRTPQSLGVVHGLMLSLLALYLGVRLFSRLSGDKSAKPTPTTLQVVELGFLLVAGTFALVELTGGPSGLLYPLVYVLVAFLVAFHSLKEAAVFIGLIALSEAAIWFFCRSMLRLSKVPTEKFQTPHETKTAIQIILSYLLSKPLISEQISHIISGYSPKSLTSKVSKFLELIFLYLSLIAIPKSKM